MPYPEQLLVPMRRDLTQYGVQEARTPDDVEHLLGPDSGTVLIVVNSVCGCAAGKARPAVGQALRHTVRPDQAATVFAGGDVAAVDRLRAKLSMYPPSSPSMFLFKKGEPVFALHRRDIEMREAPQIAKLLTEAFEQHCR